MWLSRAADGSFEHQQAAAYRDDHEKDRDDEREIFVAPMNPEQLGGFIKSEITKFARLAREAGIQPE